MTCTGLQKARFIQSEVGYLTFYVYIGSSTAKDSSSPAIIDYADFTTDGLLVVAHSLRIYHWLQCQITLSHHHHCLILLTMSLASRWISRINHGEAGSQMHPKSWSLSGKSVQSTRPHVGFGRRSTIAKGEVKPTDSGVNRKWGIYTYSSGGYQLPHDARMRYSRDWKPQTDLRR
jgi:hypothetical protein